MCEASQTLIVARLAGECITAFIATQDPQRETPARIALALDRLAVLMRVKSNAPSDEPAAHSLDLQLQAFPRPSSDCQPQDWVTAIPALWSTIKRSIESSLPPSLLLPAVRVGHVW